MKRKKALFSLLLLFCAIFALSATASAYKSEWKTISGNKYYYGSNGKKYTGGPRKIGKYYYMFDSTGKLITGKATYKSKKCYYSLSNGRLLTSFKKVNGKIYYGTKTGVLKTGLQKYKSRYYYFNSKTGAAITSTMKKIKGSWYYFGKDGKAAKSQIITYNKANYYFGSDSKRGEGVIKIGKYYYAFSKTNGKQVYGFRQYSGCYYYFNKSNKGRALTGGFKTISGKKYYFNNLGQQTRGWMVIGTKRYYMDPNNNGAQTFGKKKISGTTYNFGTKGYITYKKTGNYLIRVNRKKCVITIYDGNTPIKAMLCSVGTAGNETPVGTYTTGEKLRWHTLNGPTTGQYCTRLAQIPAYLFHSVPMEGTARNPYNVASWDYNKLGQPASHGCIRVCVADAKWLYDNIPYGTTVVISDSQPTPLGKPSLVKMKSGIGKDPTDIWS